ncbi:MAG: nucleotidyltransferase family protein [Desulfobacula sp.]|uniref:nucleotidyltransferase domain-containing protein n=1 Tax=Desulfobacula sp. TaxID=2593537 RepID=UPI0025B84DD6|nr:nucleotidyltransferase family protein [Desulfobacula sp.]MCD4720402.1 nucleotidyltransferase family protein [Desulfobacula sp.]
MKSMLANIPLEHKIVLCCSVKKSTESRLSELALLVNKKVNWDMVFDFAKNQGVLFFLYKNLKTIHSVLKIQSSKLSPQSYIVLDNLLKKTKQSFLQNSIRNLVLSARLVSIIRLLNHSGILAVPFKGPVQAETIYGDIGFRYFSDLDIIVSPENAVKARDILSENGFFLGTQIPEDQLATYLKHENFFSLHDENKAVNIDLHWELTGRYSLCPFYLKDIQQRLETVRLDKGEVSSLNFEDMLIYLCIHSSSHCWERLELICAIRQIVNSGKIIDWNNLDKRAKNLQCKRMLYLGLALARDLLDAELPEGMEQHINRAWFVKYLEKQVIKKMFFNQKPFSEKLSWRFSSLHFFVRDTFLDAVKYSLRIFFQPTVREWVNYPMPSYLLFLYYLLRPYRLIKEGFSKRNA